jgi:phosphate transport system permease protein
MGGLLIIGAVVLMLVLILNVSVPLFQSAYVDELERIESHSNDAQSLIVGVDDYGEVIYAVHAPDQISFYDVKKNMLLESATLRKPGGVADATIVGAEIWGNHQINVEWSTGHISGIRVRLFPEFDDAGTRSIGYRVESTGSVDPLPDLDIVAAIARMSDEGSTVARQTSFNSVHVTKITRSENFLGEVEEEESTRTYTTDFPGTITALTMDESGKNLYVGTDEGYLGWWDVTKPADAALIDVILASRSPITTLQMVFGDVSIAVGTEAGTVDTFFATSNEEGYRYKLAEIHRVLEATSPIVDIRPTRRDKSLLIRDASGDTHSVHMTSERYLARIPSDTPLKQFGLSTRGDTLVTISDEPGFTLWELHKPHPETNMKTLFSKVWYEKYDEPEYVWQSSASTGDYEAKFSLMPLIFGSFKGTLYAMFFSVPLALFGALYTNQFLRPQVRAIVKPSVEIMASIPSVVIGFLVALWLAPIIEDYIVAFLLALVIIPITSIPFLIIGHRIDGTPLYRKLERGIEFLVAGPVVILGCAISYWLAPGFESVMFDGDFKLWMYENANMRYDQRNAIIIAFGLGFVSIPIIFTITEDALSNLPESLRAASLALGASRWQTAWRVVLPSASPGIFAAIIIGFGRVIGETMIVLMATGNTPIMDWGPFNGMRTLSANIAVEIPEAPVDGTLYRILFLSAALLFLLTFTLNTAAELIRQRLRKKYGQFQ